MNFYLNKYGFQNPVIETRPDPNTGIIVVIPCFDEPDLISSLASLKDCVLPEKVVEVIVVINSGEHHSQQIKEQNNDTYNQALEWINQNNSETLRFYLIHEPELPKKHAGVGLARKIGMDEAVHRFHLIDTEGIIVCFDADSKCQPNYLQEIESHFKRFPKTPGCSIHFEHPLNGELSLAEYEGITGYELHLRYYNQALKYTRVPYAYHTIGSSMAVRSSAYQKQGGMNKRKAGEDFYFIHKIIMLGNFTELNSTAVIPSPRISDRVPFGTGKAIGDWVESGEQTHQTYHFGIFELIQSFINRVTDLYTTNPIAIDYSIEEQDRNRLLAFLNDIQFDSALEKIRKNAANESSFEKRFFAWFDAFKILKMVHFFRDNGYPNGPVYTHCQSLFEKINISQSFDNERDQLIFLRDFEKKS